MSIWEHKTLGELCTLEIGGTPTRNNPLFWDSEKTGSNYWVSIADLKSPEITETEERITDLGIRHSNAKLFKKGTVLLSFKLTVGRVAIAGKDLYTNEAIAGLTSEQLDHHFLYYGLQHWNLLKDVDQAIKGITLNKRKLKKIDAHYPSDKKEQAKIAEVLATIDRAIAQTEALIAKHQRIKTGLMQDLLTRGIDEHGQLRDLSTHRFKSTPLGMIPEEWEVTSLGAFLDKNGGFVQTGPFGSQLHAEEYVPSGVPTIMPKDITDGQILTDVIDHITEEKAKSLSRHRVKPNDVIFARRGDLSRAAAISEREQGWLCGTGCFLLRAPKSKLDATWLAMTYRFPSIQRQVAANAIGSTMPNLNGQVMKGLIFAFPTFEEQVAIVERLATGSRVISRNAQRVNKLLRTKQGLMQDLLSGRVSVKPLMEG